MNDELDRLHTRLERERRARRQAEVIAERGMRELWATNRELQERVALRTAELHRLAGGLEHGHAARLAVMSDLLGDVLDGDGNSAGDEVAADRAQRIRWAARLSHAWVDEVPPEASECAPIDLVDGLIDRWQRPAARSGQLLAIEVADDAHPVAFEWQRLNALADVVIGGIVRRGRPGSPSIVIGASSDAVSFAATGHVDPVDSSFTVDQRDEASVFELAGSLGTYLAVAARIVRNAGGTLTATVGPDGGLDVRAELPLVR